MFLQVIASVLRNLSWRADVNSKKTLREVGSVRALTGCALVVQKVNEGFIFPADRRRVCSQLCFLWF